MSTNLCEIKKQLREYKIRLSVCEKPNPQAIEKTLEAIYETGILPDQYDVEQCESMEELISFCQEHKVDVVFAEPEDQGCCLKAYYMNVCKVLVMEFVL